MGVLLEQINREVRDEVCKLLAERVREREEAGGFDKIIDKTPLLPEDMREDLRNHLEKFEDEKVKEFIDYIEVFLYPLKKN